MRTRTALCGIALLMLAAAAGCRHTPGGGPLREEWMDHHHSHRHWILHQYFHPRLYVYHQTCWMPMQCVNPAGGGMPHIEVIEEIPSPQPHRHLPPPEPEVEAASYEEPISSLWTPMADDLRRWETAELAMPEFTFRAHGDIR